MRMSSVTTSTPGSSRSSSTAAPLAVARHAYLATHLMRTRNGADDDGGAWFALDGGHRELAGVLRVGSGVLGGGPRPLARLQRTPGAGGLWHVWPELDPDSVEGGLVAAGFAFVEEEPVMMAALARPAAPGPDGPTAPGADGPAVPGQGRAAVPGQGRAAGPGSGQPAEAWEIIAAETGPELERWSRVWDPSIAADRRAQVAAGLFEVLELAPGRSHYALGLLVGRPVACAAVFTAEGVSAVEHVVTDSGHRGRGFGTLMTEHCLAVAREHGASQALLTASAQGTGIYRRLGFRTVGMVRRYLAPSALRRALL